MSLKPTHWSLKKWTYRCFAGETGVTMFEGTLWHVWEKGKHFEEAGSKTYFILQRQCLQLLSYDWRLLKFFKDFFSSSCRGAWSDPSPGRCTNQVSHTLLISDRERASTSPKMSNYSFKAMSSSGHPSKSNTKHSRLKKNNGHRRICSSLISEMKRQGHRSDCVLVSCLWSDSGIRGWVSGLCGEVTTQRELRFLCRVWQPCGRARQLKSLCVLAHPELSAPSNHRQSSLCRGAVCAAGSAVLIETQEEIRESWWLRQVQLT